MSDVTQILEQINRGDTDAAVKLLPLIYDELRRLAAAKMASEKPGHTLQATALVHEAYLRLMASPGRKSGEEQPCAGDGRRYFFAAAAEAMRRILVESARRKKRIKHGGERLRVELAEPAAPEPDERLLALDEALCRLATQDPTAARVVELRRFAGLSHEEVAEALDVTVYEARRKWTYGRAWLRDTMNPEKIE